jgi:hypothetical protein
MKTKKSAAELRALILSEIQGKLPCANGMDVSIGPGREQGDWVAYIIPSGQLAWADCAKLIGQVAARLREQHELSTEAREDVRD